MRLDRRTFAVGSGHFCWTGLCSASIIAASLFLRRACTHCTVCPTRVHIFLGFLFMLTILMKPGGICQPWHFFPLIQPVLGLTTKPLFANKQASVLMLACFMVKLRPCKCHYIFQYVGCWRLLLFRSFDLLVK